MYDIYSNKNIILALRKNPTELQQKTITKHNLKHICSGAMDVVINIVTDELDKKTIMAKIKYGYKFKRHGKTS